ncbi:GNAT family N-acetyltransferase [Acidisoma silvae]|uniref:GNAT family N-acetyltransferase n=1 Tax=Acidisoma silvae TaxID=2802396 RepID=A0A963YT50_9PROT|nr:GNAT family protein [Acidisoma silvae]MCB8875930.1 GNAT family N-acetyltransferase [Acidisoma silvae]
MTSLRPATPADIPFIMAVERRPGNEDVVGRWSETEHAEAIGSPNYAYFIGEDDSGQPVGFSMIQDRQEKSGNLLFRRLAVSVPGGGHGRRIFTQTRDWVFQETQAHRLWLVVYRHNVTAQTLYFSCGFVQEGVAREARLLSDGSRSDALMLSQLRPEWMQSHR